MDGIVWARESESGSEAVLEEGEGWGEGEVERDLGLCLRRTAVKNCCSEG
jgi:hypothetical protein